VKFRFVHAADLHLDTPFEGIAKADERVAQALKEASLSAFEALIELAIDRHAEFLLLAGDIYDGTERGVRAQIAFLKGVRKICERGIEVFVVRGNHDYTGGWSHLRDLPTRFHELPPAQVASLPVQRDGKLLATVHGISYDRNEVTENLALRFPRASAPGLNIGLLHCNVGDNAEHGRYSPCALDDLRAKGMGYWALGHVHRRQNLLEGNPWVVYPGNLQGRSPIEQGAKGAVVVEVENGQVTDVEFAPLDRVRFTELKIPVGEIGDLAALVDTLHDQAARLRAEHEGRGLLVRVFLTGGGPVHDQLRPLDAVDGLLAALRKDSADAQPFLWWESLQDGTRPAIDMGAIRKRASDFSAEVLRAADALRESPAAYAKWAETHLEKALQRALPDPAGGKSAEIVEEALLRALELLEDGGE